ncbi:hypothetical protein AUK11_04450 [bacterium CG2_30_37_16]|nr:MAG: hypothetical protein AUK11_04450 [bacterium CG2_30_37_16]PIP31149.1 MAG: hypothetical protein COX25_00955 [bacterium (Candidatus Howlettbacteria) CG23_combo_of_CG06-09_8_20_14_all_37_9]PJB05157.1 MAG: hypothetical protein CO123_04605 [bacterium (Candidatus Howlettbacteria) CG_4_9_14_3_um_filter_37_10]
MCTPETKDYSKYTEIKINKQNEIFHLPESLEITSLEKYGHSIGIANERGMQVLKLKLVPVLPMAAELTAFDIMVAIKALTDNGMEIFPVEDCEIAPTGMIEATMDADHILQIQSVLIKKCYNRKANCSCIT